MSLGSNFLEMDAVDTAEKETEVPFDKVELITMKEAIQTTRDEFNKGYMEGFLGRDLIKSKIYSYTKGYKEGKQKREKLKGGLEPQASQ